MREGLVNDGWIQAVIKYLREIEITDCGGKTKGGRLAK